MAELLKNIYNTQFFDGLSKIMADILPLFDKKAFLLNIFNEEWEQLELKQRMRRVSIVVSKLLPERFPESVPLVLQILDNAQEKKSSNIFPYIFLPDLIEITGLDHYKESVAALEKITKFISAEFAVRPFLIKYKEEMMAQMLLWSAHPHPHVRRLASEGCRPRLPWAMAVPYLKKDPSPILPILENLKADKSEFVRRSVANNLNDISKDHPDVVLDIVKRWFGHNEDTDKLLKHACRTMIKKGDQRALSIFGFFNNDNVDISLLKLNKDYLKLGETLEFSFECFSSASQKVRLEYAISFSKSRGKSGNKVFFLLEKLFKKEEKLYISRNFKLQHYTTRKLHSGPHTLSIKANGIEQANQEFILEV